MLERKTVYGIALALLLTITIPFSMVAPAEAQISIIEVINPAVDNGNFIFNTGTTKVGDRFNATIWIRDAVHLYAFQICLKVNDTLLDITRAWIPKWDVRYVFFGLPTIPGSPPTLIDKDGDGSHEAVIGADCLLTPSGVTFTGRRLAFIVEFEILYEPTVHEPRVWDYLNINSLDTYLLDEYLSQIPAVILSGYYEYNYAPPVHDVAITDAKSNKTVVGQGYTAFITVTVENQGNYTETFNVTVYTNTTAIGTKTVTDLSSGAKQTLTFTLNTSGFVKGHYAIWAYAEPVAGETDTTDNTYTNGNIMVTMIGDITGPTPNVPDGKVDIRDIAATALHFGHFPPHGHSEGTPECITCFNSDITGPIVGVPDNKVNVRDIATAAIHFGQIDP